MDIRALTVFCGSSPGSQPVYVEAAAAFGELLAREKITLVYGGSDRGMMGAVANAVLASGGQAIGVMPAALEDAEVAHPALMKLERVSSMHERKQRMADLSDGFVILPGGAGTMDEFFEQWTWLQIGIHRKPCAILNTAGFYDKLLDFIRDSVVGQGFLHSLYAKALIVTDDPADLLVRLRAYQPIASKKELGFWKNKSTSGS